MKTYEAWCVMDGASSVVSEEHLTAEDAVKEMLDRGYDPVQMHTDGFTVCRLLCSEQQWLECLEELDPMEVSVNAAQ